MTRLLGVFVVFFSFWMKLKNQSAFGGGTALSRDSMEQGVLTVAEDGAVASPGVFVQFFEILHQSCS